MVTQISSQVLKLFNFCCTLCMKEKSNLMSNQQVQVEQDPQSPSKLLTSLTFAKKGIAKMQFTFVFLTLFFAPIFSSICLSNPEQRR